MGVEWNLDLKHTVMGKCISNSQCLRSRKLRWKNDKVHTTKRMKKQSERMEALFARRAFNVHSTVTRTVTMSIKYIRFTITKWSVHQLMYGIHDIVVCHVLFICDIRCISQQIIQILFILYNHYFFCFHFLCLSR